MFFFLFYLYHIISKSNLVRYMSRFSKEKI